MQQWWFENTCKYSKKTIFLSTWKGSFLLMIFISFFSFFSVVNDTVYADKKDFISKVEDINSLKFTFKNNISPYIWKIIKDYKNGENILKNNDIAFSFLEDNMQIFLSILWYGAYKQDIIYIYNQFKPYKKDIFKLLWENEKKNYLIIFENIWEERPDSWFFWSFAKVSFSWWHLVDFKIYDSYYLLWKHCLTSWENWFEKCKNKKDLSLKNDIEPYKELWPQTTFLTSNIFWFTKLNGESVIKHYNQVFDDKIEGVIFLKSTILEDLLSNGKKAIWKMEVLNALNKSEGNYKDDETLKWLWWAKQDYLEYINSFDKKQLILNFIKNYDKIVQSWKVRVYLPSISKDFEDYLKQSNLIYYKKENFAYLFFYNLWFNKISKFVDHIIILDDKVYINPKELKLSNWKHILKYINVLNDEQAYYDFLKEHDVKKDSYLYDKTIAYKHILILPEHCKNKGKNDNIYVIECE